MKFWTSTLPPHRLHFDYYKNSIAAYRIPHWAFSKEQWYKDYQTFSKVTLKPDAEAEKKKIQKNHRPFMVPGSTLITRLSFLAIATTFF